MEMYVFGCLKNKAEYSAYDAPRTRLRESVPDGPTDGRTDGQTDGWMHGRTDGPTDGRTDTPSYRDAWRI